MTDDERHDIGAPPPMPANRPKRETPQERRTRLHLEAEEWRQRIEDGSDPLTDAAMLARIKDAIRAAGGDPERWTEWDPEPPADPTAEGTNPLGPYLVDWQEFFAIDHDDQEWLLEPLFAKGRSMSLYAGAKTGKSWLCLAACLALATGREFLAQPAGRKVNVLYCDFEMSSADLYDRIVAFGYGPGDDLSHLHYALLPSLPPLDTDAGGAALLAAALAVGAELVVIDTTSRVISGDENDADTMRAFYRHTGLRLKQAGITWARLDHAGKDVSKGARGSSAKNDDVDVVLRLERTDAGQKLTATHRRMSWYPEVTNVNVTEDADGIVTFGRQAPSWPAGTKELADWMDKAGLPLDVTESDLRAAMKDAGQKAGAKKFRAAKKFRQQRADQAVENLGDDQESRAESRGSDEGSDADGRADGRDGSHPDSTRSREQSREESRGSAARDPISATNEVVAESGQTTDEAVEFDDQDPFE